MKTAFGFVIITVSANARQPRAPAGETYFYSGSCTMRKLLISVCAALLICAFCGCSTDEYDDVVVNMHTPTATEVYVPVPTTLPGPTSAPTYAAPTGSSGDPAATGAAPDVTPLDIEPDYSVFDDAAFIGNSTFEGLYRYGVITHGVFFTKVGLNVLTVFTAHTDKGTVPIIDELRNGTYGKVILMFGENELGWPSPLSYIQKYEELVDAVWERQPDAEIYIVAMPPVSAGYSDGSSKGVNNATIQNFNAMMEDLAVRRGCHYIDVPKELMTYDGVLPNEASGDGLHLNLQYARYWADHICLCVMGVYD